MSKPNLQHSRAISFYKLLLKIYPKRYQKQYAEGMAQTFTDSLQDHSNKNPQLHGFVLRQYLNILFSGLTAQVNAIPTRLATGYIVYLSILVGLFIAKDVMFRSAFSYKGAYWLADTTSHIFNTSTAEIVKFLYDGYTQFIIAQAIAVLIIAPTIYLATKNLRAVGMSVLSILCFMFIGNIIDSTVARALDDSIMFGSIDTYRVSYIAVRLILPTILSYLVLSYLTTRGRKHYSQA
jgi:hypothetical protein